MYHFSNFKDNMIQLCFSLPWRFVQYLKYNEMHFFNICSVHTFKNRYLQEKCCHFLKRFFNGKKIICFPLNLFFQGKRAITKACLK